MTKLSVRLPFPGFYDSEYEAMLDQEFEQDIEYLKDELHKTEAEVDQFANAAVDGLNWRICYEAMARLYAECLADLFEPRPEWEFEALQSPREYNYSTDAIFVKVDRAWLETILATTPRDKLAALVKKNHTSYSGFHSFYPNDLDEWPADLADWKEVQLGTLLEAYLFAHHDRNDLTPWSITEHARCNGEISECYQAGWNDELREIWSELTDKQTV